MTAGLRLGRPGLYQVAVRPTTDPLIGVRLDVAGFVGVALRGPVDVATPVISWADYERRFGGTEPTPSGRDRLLPHAVQAFFAQGGRRAWVVRVAPPDAAGALEATAAFRLSPPGGPPAELAAADEGEWGSALQITLQFAVTATLAATAPAPDRLELPRGGELPDASLLRIRAGARSPAVLRWARVLTDPVHARRTLALDEPLAATGDATVEVITATLVVVDPAGGGRDERIAALGLHPDHRRFPTRVLAAESLLVRTTGEWTQPLLPDPLLGPWRATGTRAGTDRSDGVDRSSFFDDGDADADRLDEQPRHRGVDLIGRVDELGILCVPDLTWRTWPIAPPIAPPTERPAVPCCGVAPEPVLADPAPPARPWLDGSDDDDLALIVERQQRVVAVAALRRRFVALLDVPVGLPTSRITRWRAEFDSAFAAAYHPWLGVPRVAARSTAVLVPPSAFAAGIVAERELRLGLAHGPANQLALGAVRAADPVDDALADHLHQLSINVFSAERDGFRLGAARTLSADPDYRQLGVRRLITMLMLTLARHGEGLLVFEPNTVELRARLANAITELLRGLHRGGAFSGATEEESFFVRCDDTTNPRRSLEAGRLVAEIGVAPAEPLEFLVLRIASDGDGGLLVEERMGAGDPGRPEVPRV